MLKKEAIELLGGTVTSVAARIGIRPQAVSGWPTLLTPVLRDRVQAAVYRDLIARVPELAASTPGQPSPAAVGGAVPPSSDTPDTGAPEDGDWV